MKIVTIIGARPQFIKASAVSRELMIHSNVNEVILHTGQHFDKNMSEIFFEQMSIPKPNYNLAISGMGHGEMTGNMLIEIEKVLMSEKPDYIIVYGDTNSTLAGALAAKKLHIPIAHVEAGLRSFNMRMPEEVNRILTDQISDILFCPTEIAIANLKSEGFEKKHSKILNVGDVMQDSALYYANKAVQPQSYVSKGPFILATLHRAENTDNHIKLKSIVGALNELHASGTRVLMPLHPRTRNELKKQNLNLKVDLIDPVGYLEMLWLLKNCELVLTDSGGVQKEAYFFNKACVTMREQTEWVELIDIGANVLAGADKENIVSLAKKFLGVEVKDVHQLYGGGKASGLIVNNLIRS